MQVFTSIEKYLYGSSREYFDLKLAFVKFHFESQKFQEASLRNHFSVWEIKSSLGFLVGGFSFYQFQIYES